MAPPSLQVPVAKVPFAILRKTRLAMFHLLERGEAEKTRDLGSKLLEEFDASGTEPDESEYGQLVKILSIYADACADVGDHGRCRELLERRLQAQEHRFGVDHPELVEPLGRLGKCYLDLAESESMQSLDHGYAKKARKLLKRAVEIGEAHSFFNQPQPGSLMTLKLYASVCGDLQQRKELLELCVTILEQMGLQYRKNLPEYLKLLAVALRDLGEHQESKEVLERCLRIQEERIRCRHIEVVPEAVPALCNLGLDFCDLQLQSEALLGRCLSIQQQLATSQQQVAQALYSGGLVLCKLGMHQKSQHFLEHALKIQEEHSNALEVARTLVNLGGVCHQLGQHQREKELTNQALQLLREHSSTHPDLQQGLGHLAWSGEKQDEHQMDQQSEVADKEEVKACDDGENGASHDAHACNALGMERLREGKRREAIAAFTRAIELDVNDATAYNNRGIAYELEGMTEAAQEDCNKAEELAGGDADMLDKLKLTRKWKPVGWQGRGETRAETRASDADFLLSFATPDTDVNNKILELLGKGVAVFEGRKRSVSFCHDRSLGMGVHIHGGEQQGRTDPQFDILDQERKPGEFPKWFEEYYKAAEETRHGILILQLTEDYLKSKACRWEFGYLRKPELVHVVVKDEKKLVIVHWRQLMCDVHLCKQACMPKRDVQKDVEEVLEGRGTDATRRQLEDLFAINKVAKLASLVRKQENQAWCELPLREVAYTLSDGGPFALKQGRILMGVLLETGQTQRAQRFGALLLRESDASAKELSESDHEQYVQTLHLLSQACGALGDYCQSKEVLERCLQVQEKRFGADHPEIVQTLNRLGNVHGSLGNLARQKEFQERAVELCETHFGPNDLKSVASLANLAEISGRCGDLQLAKELWERCISIVELDPDASRTGLGCLLNGLALVCGKLGDLQRKKDLLEQGLRHQEQVIGKEHPDVLPLLRNLAQVCQVTGDHDRCKALLEQRLRATELHYGTGHRELASVLIDVSITWGALGELEKKKEMLLKAHKIFEEHSDHVNVAIALLNLGSTWSQLGDPHQYRGLAARALEILEQQPFPHLLAEAKVHFHNACEALECSNFEAQMQHDRMEAASQATTQDNVQIKQVDPAEAMSIVKSNVGWNPAMEKCLGQEGVVIVDKTTRLKVKMADGSTWWWPAQLLQGFLPPTDAEAGGSTINAGITCDGCHIAPLVGTRYKCRDCCDFDLCSACYGNWTGGGRDHPQVHRFRAMTSNTQVFDS